MHSPDGTSRKRFSVSPAWLSCALLLSIVVALYGATLHYSFVWDDAAYIRENYRIHALDWLHVKSFWTRTYLGHYAPVHHLLLALIYSISGNQPFWFHLANLLLHMLVVVLLYVLIGKMESPRVALVACLLYVVHPTHVETVAWISESKSTLSFALVLASGLMLVQYHESKSPVRLVLAVLLFGLSALTKINTVVAPAIFVIYDYRKKKSIRELDWLVVGIFLVASLALVAAHLQAFGSEEGMLDGIPYSPRGIRLMNFPMLLSFYMDTALFPYSLSAWEQFPVQTTFTWVVGLAWAGLVLMTSFLYRASQDVKFWVAWFVVFLMPVLQLVPFPIWVADRYLYIPLVGVCVLLAKLGLWCWDRAVAFQIRWVLPAFGAMIVLMMAWKTHVGLPAWRNELSLWEATVPKCRQSAYCHASFGLALMDAGQLQRGGDELVEAVKIRPSPLFLGYLGDALTLSARNYPEAIKVFKLALRDVGTPGAEKFGARTGVLQAKLARAYLKQGEVELASQAIRTGAAYDLRNPVLATADIFLQWRLGDMQAAAGSLLALTQMTGIQSNYADYLDRFWSNREETNQMLSTVLAARQ